MSRQKGGTWGKQKQFKHNTKLWNVAQLMLTQWLQKGKDIKIQFSAVFATTLTVKSFNWQLSNKDSTVSKLKMFTKKAVQCKSKQKLAKIFQTQSVMKTTNNKGIRQCWELLSHWTYWLLSLSLCLLVLLIRHWNWLLCKIDEMKQFIPHLISVCTLNLLYPLTHSNDDIVILQS